MLPKQKLVIILSIVLAVLLYLAPKQLQEEQTIIAADYSSLIEEAKKNLAPEKKTAVEKLEKEAIEEKEVKNKIILLDSLRKFWLHNKHPAIYAAYGKSVAEVANTEQDWMAAADDFMKAGRFSKDANKATMYKGAIECYEKTLAMNPANLSAKTKLGTCYVESASLLGNQPMKGISLLREVIGQDSTNIEANLQLGLFSVTSQQFDKAIDRFRRILKIDSTHIDMYVYLGDTYIQMGDKANAIENYENYRKRVKDSLIVKDIEEYIKKLKQQP